MLSNLSSRIITLLSLSTLLTFLFSFYFLIAEEIDYLFDSDYIIFNGSYSVGDSECVMIDIVANTDNVVEGMEVIKANVNEKQEDDRRLSSISIFIIDNDCMFMEYQQTWQIEKKNRRTYQEDTHSL